MTRIAVPFWSSVHFPNSNLVSTTDTGDELVTSDPESEPQAANAINTQAQKANETERVKFFFEICMINLHLVMIC